MAKQKPTRDPGDAFPWAKASKLSRDASPWKLAAFAGYSKASHGWYAWLNTMPPKPDDLHVVGDVVVPNPGVTATLAMREPQGINPTILLLELSLAQQPGVWPAVMTNVQARFDRVVPSGASAYTSVEVFLAGEKIVDIDQIDTVS